MGNMYRKMWVGDRMWVEEVYVEQIEAENKRLKQAILDFGNNPAGFDWAVLDKIYGLEAKLEKYKQGFWGRACARFLLKDRKLRAVLRYAHNFARRVEQTELAEAAMKLQAEIEKVIEICKSKKS